MSSNLAKHTDTAKATKFTRGESDSAFEAKAGRTDAVNAGIVKKATSRLIASEYPQVIFVLFIRRTNMAFRRAVKFFG